MTNLTQDDIDTIAEGLSRFWFHLSTPYTKALLPAHAKATEAVIGMLSEECPGFDLDRFMNMSGLLAPKAD